MYPTTLQHLKETDQARNLHKFVQLADSGHARKLTSSIRRCLKYDVKRQNREEVNCEPPRQVLPGDQAAVIDALTLLVLIGRIKVDEDIDGEHDINQVSKRHEAWHCLKLFAERHLDWSHNQ